MGDDLPEAEWVIGPVIYCQVEVVCCDCSDDVGAAGLDCFNGFFGCAVLEDNFKLFYEV